MTEATTHYGSSGLSPPFEIQLDGDLADLRGQLTVALAARDALKARL